MKPQLSKVQLSRAQGARAALPIMLAAVDQRRAASLYAYRVLCALTVSLVVALCIGVPRSLLAQPVTPQQTDLATVSPYLQAELAATDGPVTFLVILRDQPDLAAVALHARRAGTAALDAQAARSVRGQAVYDALTAHARATQADLIDWLTAQGAAYRPFYIVNMLEVRGDWALVEALRGHPAVERIVANPLVAGVEAAAPPRANWAEPLILPTAASPVFTYGLADANVPDVWAQGVRGQGIVVAGQDTGVEWTHSALRDSYRGWNGAAADHDYAWFDAWAGASNDLCAGVVGPCDDTGHGTHTLGTLVGEGAEMAFGVAPDAQWIACRNMLRGAGTPASYTACFQFFLAPYPLGGDPFVDGRPALAPHIINNSWSCPPFEGCDTESLRAVTAAMRAAGQLVVASAGNSGPRCATVNVPIGIYADVLTVGAHGQSGIVASFSSRGPVNGSGLLKPDLTAPGLGILSSLRNDSLGTLSGTSMAAPHVAGAAALLWSAVPDLIGEPERTIQLLIKSATPVLDSACIGMAGDNPMPVSPNPTYGYGRLDVAAALHMAQTPWQVAVKVSDESGATVDGATVTWIDAHTGYTLTATTAFDGIAHLAPVYTGRYTLQVQHESGGIELADIHLADDADHAQGEVDGAPLSAAYHAQRTGLVDPEPTAPYRFYLPVLSGP